MSFEWEYSKFTRMIFVLEFYLAKRKFAYIYYICIYSHHVSLSNTGGILETAQNV